MTVYVDTINNAPIGSTVLQTQGGSELVTLSVILETMSVSLLAAASVTITWNDGQARSKTINLGTLLTSAVVNELIIIRAAASTTINYNLSYIGTGGSYRLLISNILSESL